MLEDAGGIRRVVLAFRYSRILECVYYGKNVPLFRRNGYRKSGAMIP